MREISLAGRNLAGLFDPVFAECSLQPIDDRTNDAQSGVAPVMAILRMSAPLFRESISADVSDSPVDDHHFSVVAIVHASEVAEAEGMKHADLRARVA